MKNTFLWFSAHLQAYIATGPYIFNIKIASFRQKFIPVLVVLFVAQFYVYKYIHFIYLVHFFLLLTKIEWDGIHVRIIYMDLTGLNLYKICAVLMRTKSPKRLSIVIYIYIYVYVTKYVYLYKCTILYTFITLKYFVL